MPIAPGTRIGTYVIVGPLGEGGMGAVGPGVRDEWWGGPLCLPLEFTQRNSCLGY